MLLDVAVMFIGFYISLVLLALLAAASKTAPLQAHPQGTAAAARNSAAATYSNNALGGTPVTAEGVSNNGTERRRAG